MSTKAQLTPFAVVPATSQVTVWLEAAAHDTFVFGALTKNGPAVPFTFTTIKSEAVCPPPATLSLAVTEKLNVRAIDGNTSQVVEVAPLSTVASAGKYLTGLVVPANVLNIGPAVLVAEGAALFSEAGETASGSRCSQQ